MTVTCCVFYILFCCSGSKFPVFSMSYNPAENAVLLCTVSILNKHVNVFMVYTGILVVFHIFYLLLFTSCRGRPTWRTAPMTCTLFPKKVTLRTLMVQKHLTKVILVFHTLCFVNYLSFILYLSRVNVLNYVKSLTLLMIRCLDGFF